MCACASDLLEAEDPLEGRPRARRGRDGDRDPRPDDLRCGSDDDERHARRQAGQGRRDGPRPLRQLASYLVRAVLVKPATFELIP